MSLKIVTFLWGMNYKAEHVNKLYRACQKNIQLPHEFICITDRAASFNHGIKILPLWDKCKNLGRCYNRLYVFSDDMREFIGERFVCIDIDCVVTGDMTMLFDRNEDFIINSYQPSPTGFSAANQVYNGAMFMMNAGARRKVWDTFCPVTSPQIIAARKDIIGSDQAWIRHVLGPDEMRWGANDGVYEARNIKNDLPEDARIVFFAGNRDPETSKFKWVRQHYDRA